MAGLIDSLMSYLSGDETQAEKPKKLPSVVAVTPPTEQGFTVNRGGKPVTTVIPQKPSVPLTTRQQQGLEYSKQSMDQKLDKTKEITPLADKDSTSAAYKKTQESFVPPNEPLEVKRDFLGGALQENIDNVLKDSPGMTYDQLLVTSLIPAITTLIGGLAAGSEGAMAGGAAGFGAAAKIPKDINEYNLARFKAANIPSLYGTQAGLLNQGSKEQMDVLRAANQQLATQSKIPSVVLNDNRSLPAEPKPAGGGRKYGQMSEKDQIKFNRDFYKHIPAGYAAVDPTGIENKDLATVSDHVKNKEKVGQFVREARGAINAFRKAVREKNITKSYESLDEFRRIKKILEQPILRSKSFLNTGVLQDKEREDLERFQGMSWGDYIIKLGTNPGNNVLEKQLDDFEKYINQNLKTAEKRYKLLPTDNTSSVPIPKDQEDNYNLGETRKDKSGNWWVVQPDNNPKSRGGLLLKKVRK